MSGSSSFRKTFRAAIRSNVGQMYSLFAAAIQTARAARQRLHSRRRLAFTDSWTRSSNPSDSGLEMSLV